MNHSANFKYFLDIVESILYVIKYLPSTALADINPTLPM